MALSSEDKKDVKGAFGKALANKVASATRDGGKKSTRTHFTGVATRTEQGKKGSVKGYYHDTNVATKDKKGSLHFRTGGYLTPTTARRMQTFAKEHGGRDIAISRRKGTLSAKDTKTGKEYKSGYKGGEHRMTIKD